MKEIQMYKKILTLLSIFVLSAMLLGACSPAAEPTEEMVEPTEVMAEPTAEPTEEMAEPTEEMAEPTEVMTEEAVAPDATIRVWADDTRAAILVGLADAFLETYNVELIVEEVSGIRDQFIIAAPAGEGPDIIVGAHDWIGSLIASGLLAPLDLGSKASDFTDLSLAGFTYTDGQLYGMPYATENLGFFYNTDYVTEVPTTWQGVMDLGQQLMDEGKISYVMALAGTPTYDALPMQTAFGGYIFGFNDDGTWNPTDIGLNSDGEVAALSFMREQIEAGRIPDSFDWDTGHTLFETGETAFLMAGPWALERIRASGVPYAVTSFPAAEEGGEPGAPFLGVQGFMVNAFSENVLLAQAFLTEFVATSDVMQQLYETGNRPSAYIPVLEMTADADLAAMDVAGANAVLMPYIPEMGSVWGAWGSGVTLALTGEMPVDEAMNDAVSQINDLVLGALAGMVNVPGSWQAAGAGCGSDWDPACATSALTDNGDGTFSGTFTIPAGDYEYKAALDGSWAVNYGSDGLQDGPNYTLSLAADSTVTFTYDSETKLITVTTE
jgi:maltose/maltodextrin transport system substrate-binding protein/arabinogalactan oligomer/maltooligosaccharide transport system substrate-binding protein